MNLDDELRALERTIRAEGVADPMQDARFRLAFVRRGRFDELRAWVVVQALQALKSSPPASSSASRWIRMADTVVARVSELTKGWPTREVRRAFRDAYPFGIRGHWPYRAWCRAVRLALGLRPPRPARGSRSRAVDRTADLFGGAQ